MRILTLLAATALLASLTFAADTVGATLPPLPPFRLHHILSHRPGALWQTENHHRQNTGVRI